MKFSSGTNGKMFLDWVKVGNIIQNEEENDSFYFDYEPQESEFTLWNGKEGIIRYQ